MEGRKGMDIKKIRERLNMTQREFAEYFEIPIRTIQEWEQERCKPPVYVIKMIEKIIELER